MTADERRRQGARQTGNFLFWLAVCLALGGVLAYLYGNPGLAVLWGLAALAAAGMGICAGLVETKTYHKDI